MKGNTNTGKNSNTNAKKKASNGPINKTEKVKGTSKEVASKYKAGEIKTKETKKEVKSANINKIKTPISETNEVANLIKIIAFVCIIVLVALGLAYVIDAIRKGKEEEPEVIEAAIQYEEILVGSILNKAQTEYYVLVIAEKDLAFNNYYYFFDKNKTNSSVILYFADMKNAFNKGYAADESNLKVSNITEFKLAESALVKINNKRVVEAYEGKDAILVQLDKIVK